MTTTIYASTLPKKKNRLLTYLALVLAAVLVLGFLLTHSGIDKALIKQKLDQYAALLQEKGREQGRDVSLTYGDIEVAGGFIHKHVIIRNPQLSIKPLAQPGATTPPNPADTVAVTTPQLVIYPETRDLSSLRFSLPEPLNFTSADAPDKSLLKIAASTPIELIVTQNKVNNQPFTRILHTAPSAFDFTYLREKQTAGEEDATPTVVPVYDTIHMTVASGSTIETNFAADGSGLGKADVSFKQITTVPQSAPQGIVTIAGVEAHWRNEINNKNVVSIANKMHVGPITAPPDVLPYAPIELTVDASYDGASALAPDAPAAGLGNDPKITVRQLTLSTKNSTLSATADFTSSPTDVLPMGKAQLNLTNIPFIREEAKKRGLLTADNEAWIADLVQQITGTPFDQLKDLALPIERSRGSAFKVGNTTFEEVFATFLKHALKVRPATGGAVVPTTPETGAGTATVPGSHTPKLPPADKPKAAPIALPDTGTRG